MNDAMHYLEGAIPLWRATARLAGRDWKDAAYGFGGPDVAEGFGTSDEIGAELARFLNSLDQQDVVARWISDGFSVQLEVEPREGSSTLAGQAEAGSAEDPVPLWEASASVGNADGDFDACYSFGNVQRDEGHLLGTARELGAELARVLREITRQDVQTMKYGTDRFFLLLEIELPWRAIQEPTSE